MVIFEAYSSAARLKFYIPFQQTDWRNQIENLNTSFYHPRQKLWSIINSVENLEKLKSISNGQFEIRPLIKASKPPVKKFSENGARTLERYQSKIILKGYSTSTLNVYSSCFKEFLSHFNGQNIDSLKKDDIEAFLAK